MSKTGFFVSVSSRLNPFKDGWLAFNPGKGGEWVTGSEDADAWIEISCPTPVRTWKIRLAGQTSFSNNITSWKLSGRVDINDAFTDMYASQTELGPYMHEFLISADRAYRIYRLSVITTEAEEKTGLSYFQIFIKSYYAYAD